MPGDQDRVCKQGLRSHAIQRTEKSLRDVHRLQKEGKSTRAPTSPTKTSKKKTSNVIQNINETGAEDAETPDTPSKHGGRHAEFLPFKFIIKESANQLAELRNYVELNMTE